MSLESQLTEKAGEVFVVAYRKLFTDFMNGFRVLTGVNFEYGGLEKNPSLRPLAEALSLRYIQGGAKDSALVYEAAKALHREKFIAEFIRKSEELSSFVNSTEES